MSQAHVLLVDGLNLVRRIHAAQPEQPAQQFAERVSQALNKLKRGQSASHLLLVWDGDRNSWRKQLYPHYKAGRNPMPESLSNNLEMLRLHCQQAGFQSLQAPQEADDAIASIALALRKHEISTTIVSTDKGFSPLLDKGVKLWDHFNSKAIDAEAVEHRFQLPPKMLTQYWALAGDSGNKIPGVTGIGNKTALQLLQRYRSVKGVYQHLDELPQGQQKKLNDGKEMARLSYQLVQLKTDLTFNLKLNQYRC
ncbi:flap endonuclease Xni [Paraferrimonas sedimenticola]|uniref:Flap endonuclease Xni n=1 Tax=Paraferrimonas sedimenticola TaxID=375674 RepID=A0AA37RR83_9GAMM|nr:flap endonuclease Xni [Paraferrimonas sedimenticola]GLP95225.1 Flap endonuclease Xni [Paraferrimonas sedimenticola]